MDPGGYLATGFFSFVAGLITTAILVARSRKKKPPKLAGTAIPQIGDGLDIAKRYDILYSGDYGASFVERLSVVRIVGYVGSDDDDSVGKMYIRSRWLVVEFADGRRAYLMPHAILSLSESAES